MTRLGLKAAFRYGEKLTAFKSMEEAEKYFFTYKDKLLGKFEKKCAQYNFFTPDYSPGDPLSFHSALGLR